MKELIQEKRWEIFANLVEGINFKTKFGILWNESITISIEELWEEICEFLPAEYKKDATMLRFVKDITQENLYGYKLIYLDHMMQRKKEGEYPNLKSIVLGTDKLREAFYASKYMNPNPENKHLMRLPEMEHMAALFLEQQKVHEWQQTVCEINEKVVKLEEAYKRAEKRDKRLETLLREILVWRNNEFRMGHEKSLWKLDEIMRNVGVAAFRSEDGCMYDPEKHEAEAILPCDEEEKMGRIAESSVPGYFYQGKVLVREDVVVYKGGVQHG